MMITFCNRNSFFIYIESHSFLSLAISKLNSNYLVRRGAHMGRHNHSIYKWFLPCIENSKQPTLNCLLKSNIFALIIMKYLHRSKHWTPFPMFIHRVLFFKEKNYEHLRALLHILCHLSHGSRCCKSSFVYT